MTIAATPRPDIAHGERNTGKPRLWGNLGFQVAISMVAAIVVGLFWPDFASSLKVLGDLFLRLIKAAVAPLVFLTVVAGIAAAGDIKRVGKVGLIAIFYFEVVSTIALAVGMLFDNIIGVGRNLAPVSASTSAVRGAEAAAKAASISHTSLDQFLINVFPDNFVGAFARGELLQVLVIALIFGFGLMALKPQKRAAIEAGLDTISTAFFEFIHVIMRLAPIGTFGAVAYAVGSNGTAVLIFLANAYGVPLSWEQELGILAIMLLTSKGAATVSGGSFVVFAATVTTSGILPADGLALIFGVYRFLSIALSTCTVIGNTVATVVVAKLTGEFEEPARTELPASDGLI